MSCTFTSPFNCAIEEKQGEAGSDPSHPQSHLHEFPGHSSAGTQAKQAQGWSLVMRGLPVSCKPPNTLPGGWDPPRLPASFPGEPL